MLLTNGINIDVWTVVELPCDHEGSTTFYYLHACDNKTKNLSKRTINNLSVCCLVFGGHQKHSK